MIGMSSSREMITIITAASGMKPRKTVLITTRNMMSRVSATR